MPLNAAWEAPPEVAADVRLVVLTAVAIARSRRRREVKLVEQTGFTSPPKLNHASGMEISDSSKYFAVMEAFASSRNWKTTLFLSAIKSN